MTVAAINKIPESVKNMCWQCRVIVDMGYDFS